MHQCRVHLTCEPDFRLSAVRGQCLGIAEFAEVFQGRLISAQDVVHHGFPRNVLDLPSGEVEIPCEGVCRRGGKSFHHAFPNEGTGFRVRFVEFDLVDETSLECRIEVLGKVGRGDHDALEVIDLKTGAKKIKTRSCYVIANLEWIKGKDPYFKFSSCGDRFLEACIKNHDDERPVEWENVITVLKDIQCLIFPGYRVAEEIDSLTLRFVTGERVNRIVSMLTREIKNGPPFVYS